jgi:iron complex outermembrane receptor protein
MKKSILAAWVMMMLANPQLWGQQKVRGIVVDQNSKEPLVGATVQNDKGTGTVTDGSGRFAIEAASGSTLIVRFVGYQQKESKVTGDLMYIDMRPSYELEQLIIKGVRAKADDPVAKTTVSKELIKREYVGEHPIFLLERLSPSIYSYSESGTSVGNYGQIRLRGIGQERINFTLNGAPLNDMIDHGVYFSNFTDITSNFESVQVQRGVGTSATGASSYAGSINMESFNVSGSSPFSSVQLGAGSFNTYRTNFAVNTGVNEKNVGFYSSYSRLWSEGYRQHTSSDASSFFITGGYYGEKDLIRVTAFSGRSENGLGYYTIDQSLLDQDPTYNVLTENDKDDFAQYMVQLQYSRKISDEWSWSNTAYYGGAGGDFAEGTPDDDSVYVENYYWAYPTTYFSINYPLKNDHYGVISNFFWEKERLELSTGIHAYLFNRENREAILPDNANPYYKDHTKKRELALFTKASYGINQRLSVFGDLQLRMMKMRFLPDYSFIYGDILNLIELVPIDTDMDYQFLNARAGLKYNMQSDLSVFASFGRSGREPTRIDLIGGFQLNGDALSLLQNPGFEPEYVNDLEAGLHINKARLAMSTNVFYMDFENEIAPIGEQIAFGVQRRVNIADSYRLGWETEWNYLLTESVAFRGNLSLSQSNIAELTIDSMEVRNVQHILTPNIIGRSGISWTSINDKFFSTLDVNYMSQSYMEYTNDEDFVVPQFMTMDLTLNYQPWENFGLQLQVRNLLDKTYYTYGTPGDVDYSGELEPGYFVQAPRNFYVTGTLKF